MSKIQNNKLLFARYKLRRIIFGKPRRSHVNCDYQGILSVCPIYHGE